MNTYVFNIVRVYLCLAFGRNSPRSKTAREGDYKRGKITSERSRTQPEKRDSTSRHKVVHRKSRAQEA